MRSVRKYADIALLVLAAAAVPWLTSERTVLPSSIAVGVVAAVLVGGGILAGGRPRLFPDGLLAAAIGCAAASAHLGAGVVHGHDTFDHIWGAWAWLQAWSAGDPFPIWLHHLGLGQPLPMFYGPLPFWVMAPFAATGAGAAHMLEGSFVVAGVTAGCLAWYAVASWTRDRSAALVAAVAWSFAPYRLLDANYRSALGETWALALMPFVLYAFERLLVRRGFRRFRRAAIATALLALAHPISVVLVVVLLPVLWLAATRPWSRSAAEALRAGFRAAGAGVTGVALAAFFTLPLVSEQRYLDLAPSTLLPSGLLYSQYGVHPAQLVDRRLWSSLEWSETEQEERTTGRREMPFYCGMLLLGALAAATFTGRAGGGPRVILRCMGAVGIAALVLSLVAPSHVAVRLPLFPILQFPWRFLGPASAAAALALGLLVAPRGAERPAPHRFLIAMLALATLVDGFPFTGTVRRLMPWRGLANYDYAPGEHRPLAIARPWALRVVGAVLPPVHGRFDVGIAHGVYREYFTPAVRALIKTGDPKLYGLGLDVRSPEDIRREKAAPYARLLHRKRGMVSLDHRRSAGRIEVTTRGLRGEVEVAEQYFPGWQVEVNGRWREVEPTVRGLLGARVTPGQRLLRFRFDRWRSDRLAGWMISGVVGAVLLGGGRLRLGHRWRRRR